MEIPTLLRQAEHRELAALTLTGKVLDLGGDARSSYRRLIQGTHTVTTVNMDERARPDVVHDLEKPLPFPDAAFDHVLLVNVLEHVYDYQGLLKEAKRVLGTAGSVTVVVPFLFPIHPSPADYRRFTADALRRELGDAGFTKVQVRALGQGVFSAAYVLIDRLLPGFLRALCFYTVRYAVLAVDALFTRAARLTGKQYDPATYALGYVITAEAHG